MLVIGDAWKGSAKRTRNFEFSEFSLRRIPLSFILNTGELGGFDGVARFSLPRVGPDMSLVLFKSRPADQWLYMRMRSQPSLYLQVLMAKRPINRIVPEW